MRISEQQANRSDESTNSQIFDGVVVDATPSRLGAEGIGAEGIRAKGIGAEGIRAEGIRAEGIGADSIALQADADAGKQPEAVQGRVQYHAAGYDPAWLLLFAVQVSA